MQLNYSTAKDALGGFPYVGLLSVWNHTFEPLEDRSRTKRLTRPKDLGR